MFFVDALGREHQGDKGDYLVESSTGTWCISPRHIFEDIYVAMVPAGEPHPLLDPQPRLEELAAAAGSSSLLDTNGTSSS
jgi:hypothetical protein